MEGFVHASVISPGTTLSHPEDGPSQFHSRHIPSGHSAFVLQTWALARPTAGQVPVWQVIVKLPLVSPMLKQQIWPFGQSLVSSHAISHPEHVLPAATQVVADPMQQSVAGTLHPASPPQSTTPGSHGAPPIGPTQLPESLPVPVPVPDPPSPLAGTQHSSPAPGAQDSVPIVPLQVPGPTATHAPPATVQGFELPDPVPELEPELELERPAASPVPASSWVLVGELLVQ